MVLTQLETGVSADFVSKPMLQLDLNRSMTTPRISIDQYLREVASDLRESLSNFISRNSVTAERVGFLNNAKDPVSAKPLTELCALAVKKLELFLGAPQISPKSINYREVANDMQFNLENFLLTINTFSDIDGLSSSNLHAVLFHALELKHAFTEQIRQIDVIRIMSKKAIPDA